MAFNLDKNDSSGSSKKFDLSKSAAPTSTGLEQEKSKSKTWFFVLPLLLIAGIAAWYFLSKPGKQSESTVASATDTSSTAASTDPANQNNIGATPADTTATVKNETTSTTTAAGNNETAVQSNATATGASLNNSTPATFAQGSHAISNVDPSLVKDIITFLEKNPGSLIQVNGYASSEGDLAFNQQISQSRANAFKSYLVSKGIEAGRVNASGKGISDPISSNDTEEGRIKNRRVQIVFQ